MFLTTNHGHNFVLTGWFCAERLCVECDEGSEFVNTVYMHIRLQVVK
jgi:hypothetical protein